MRINFEAIGIVRNAVREGTDDYWGRIVSEIELRSDLAEGLTEVGQFSHVVVVFYMSEARFEPRTHLVRRPRDRADMPLVGIFSQRAKHRPNPIGVTTVPVVRVSGRSLFVRGLDAIDGTPVLDIKPHAPAFDAPADVRVGVARSVDARVFLTGPATEPVRFCTTGTQSSPPLSRAA